MTFPYDFFTPSKDPDEVLDRIKRRARHRRIARTTAALSLLALALFLVLKPGEPEKRTVTLSIQKVWTGGESAHYTLVQSPVGNNIIFFHKEDNL